MSPRRSVADAQRTRAGLIDRAAALASTDGLEGLTLGRLADAAALSKSGVVRHFPTKEALQLETLAHALDVFTAQVWAPVADLPAGLARLDALLASWMTFLAGDTFPGGCFLSAVSLEFDGRIGPVRDATAAGLRRWLGALAREVAAAVDAGELVPATDPAAVAYQLNALGLAANQARQLLDDDAAPARSLEAMRHLLTGSTVRPRLS